MTVFRRADPDRARARPRHVRPGAAQWRLPRVARLALAFAAGATSVVAVALVVIELGTFDVAASSPHSRLVYWVVHTTMRRSVERAAAEIAAPPQFSAQQAEAGFALYEAHCLACHGAPGVGQAPVAGGLNPPPPYLLDASRRWRPAELYWIVRRGVKMTAMPAWEQRLDPRQTWEVVAFLEVLPRLNAPAYARLRRAHAGPATQGQ